MHSGEPDQTQYGLSAGQGLPPPQVARASTPHNPSLQCWPLGQCVPSATEHGSALQLTSGLPHSKCSVDTQREQHVKGALQSLGSSHAYTLSPSAAAFFGRQAQSSASLEPLLVQTSRSTLQRFLPQDTVLSVEPLAPARGGPWSTLGSSALSCGGACGVLGVGGALWSALAIASGLAVLAHAPSSSSRATESRDMAGSIDEPSTTLDRNCSGSPTVPLNSSVRTRQRYHMGEDRATLWLTAWTNKSASKLPGTDAGLTPSVRQSANSSVTGRITKAGSKKSCAVLHSSRAGGRQQKELDTSRVTWRATEHRFGS